MKLYLDSKKVVTKLQFLNKSIYKAKADQTSVINFFSNVFNITYSV